MPEGGRSVLRVGALLRRYFMPKKVLWFFSIVVIFDAHQSNVVLLLPTKVLTRFRALLAPAFFLIHSYSMIPINGVANICLLDSQVLFATMELDPLAEYFQYRCSAALAFSVEGKLARWFCSVDRPSAMKKEFLMQKGICNGTEGYASVPVIPSRLCMPISRYTNHLCHDSIS